MKIVLDTDVFVSGVFFSGPPHQILQAWRGGKVQLVISPEILDEYSRVSEALSERFPAVNLRPVLELVTLSSQRILGLFTKPSVMMTFYESIKSWY